ncbi:aspartyl-tRNA synthetase [Bacillus salacetis]|uniref:aspartyl-tRNA synthetase n=1 Tax=Bacillus salacetis TaxID=2315464 RepID=UPI003BA37F61
MKKSTSITITVILLISIGLLSAWGYNEQKISFAEPNEAILSTNKGLVLIPAYKNDDRSLFFFIKDKNNLGAAVAHKGVFGWKSGMSAWSPFNKRGDYETFGGYQGYGDQLIYGLIRNPEKKIIMADDREAAMLNLEMLPQSVVKEYNLKDLYLWYFESENTLNIEQLKLLQKDTQEVIQSIDL